MGQASPQPIVMTTSAALTLSPVRGLGYSREMSRPISAMARTTAGLSWLAGWDPAEETRTRPAAWWSSRAAAIWERPALWVQTNSTSGMSVTDAAFLGQPVCSAGSCWLWGTMMSAASAGASRGYSARITSTARAPPMIWAAMNAGAEDGAIPAKVLENIRPIVIAGLAKLVEEVNQYAAPM